jgi:protein O-GlcNAc transferase
MDAAAIRKLLETSLSHHQSGRLVEAEKGYARVLADQPRHPDALHLLGVLCGQLGRFDRAIDLLNQSIAANPNAADYHSDLAKICRKAGRIDAAMAAFENACRLDLGRAENYLHLGNLCLQQGENQRAIAAFHKCVKISPNLIEAWTNLGIAQSQLAQLPQAIIAFQQAVQIKPDYAGGYYNLAKALGESGQLEIAIETYRIALAIQPDFAEAYFELGIVLRQQGQPEASVDAYRQALRCAPDHFHAWQNLGATLKDMGLLDGALHTFDRAIELRPDDPDIHSNRICTVLFHPGFDAESILAEQQRWDCKHGQRFTRTVRHDNNRDPERRLRIGYVSPDFREHVVGLNVLPLFREHNRESFEIFAYADVPHPDHVTRHFRSYCDHWRDIAGCKTTQLTESVLNDRIDILVDLSLHLARSRLIAFTTKPAPVQMTFAGYPGGTGLSAMDYRLTDPYLDPIGETDACYVEQSIRLPQSFWCYDPAAMMFGLSAPPAVHPLPALANGYITFGCLNNFCKVNDAVLDRWAQVLLAVADSHLLLLMPAASALARARQRFHNAGVDPERIEFVTNQPRESYFNTLNRIDVGLDTFPYNGHTTSLDSLWMGVPVITSIGKTVVGRAGFSQLSNLRMTELVARSPDEFVAIAVELASDLPRLGNMRMILRQRMLESPLTDSTTFTRGIEAAYRDAWRGWCAG